MAENCLPAGLKEQLTSLGLWAMGYSTLALLRGLPIEPLIDVNRNVLDGLSSRAAEMPANHGPAAPFSA